MRIAASSIALICCILVGCVTSPSSELTLAEGNRLLAAGNTMEAIETYRQGLAIDGTNRNKIGYNLSAALFHNGNYSEAAALATTLFKEYPDKHELGKLAALAYEKLEEPAEATEIWELMLDENPYDAALLKEAAAFFIRSNQPTHAADIAYRLLILGADDDTALDILSRTVTSTNYTWSKILQEKDFLKKISTTP